MTNTKLKALGIVLALGALTVTAFADDDLLGGKKKGGGSGSSSSGSGKGGGSNGGGSSTRDREKEKPKESGNRGNSGNRDNSSERTRSDTQENRGGSGRDDVASRRAGRTTTGPTGTSHNQYTRTPAPSNYSYPEYNDARRQANREENTRPARGYRNGYYGYTRDTCDDHFSYGYYRYEYRNDCVPSPWYGYTNQPAYISNRRINWDCNDYDFNWRDNYSWRMKSRYDSRSEYYYLDLSIRDLVWAFENGDTRALNNLIPYRYRINIKSDGYRSYSLGSDDFYDLMLDLTSQTRTSDFEICSVKLSDRGAQVTARHEYYDAWGRTSVSNQRYTFVPGRTNWKIVEFENNQRGW